LIPKSINMNDSYFFIRMLNKDCYWHTDKHTDIHIIYFIFLLFIFFVIFTLLIVSDVHGMRLINEYVCKHGVHLLQCTVAEALTISMQ